MNVAPPKKGLSWLIDDVAVVSGATDTVGGKLEEEKEVATTTSAGFKVPRSGTRVEEGRGVVGLKVGGTVFELLKAEGEKDDVMGDVVGNVEGDVVGVAVTGAPAVGVVGSLVVVEEEERAREEEEGVVQVDEGEESSVGVLGVASPESVVTVINHS